MTKIDAIVCISRHSLSANAGVGIAVTHVVSLASGTITGTLGLTWIFDDHRMSGGEIGLLKNIVIR